MLFPICVHGLIQKHLPRRATWGHTDTARMRMVHTCVQTHACMCMLCDDDTCHTRMHACTGTHAHGPREIYRKQPSNPFTIFHHVSAQQALC
jgi:hypothetical protein